MKLDFLTDAVDKILRIDEEDKNADMQHPGRVAVFGVAMTFCGLFLAIIALASGALSMLFFAIFSFLVATLAFLCYKFQRIFVLSDTEFQYTTFYGKRKIYKFEHIRAIRSNSDSHVLILVDGRINIEPNTVMSERLRELFNNELARVYKENAEKKARIKALKSSRSVRLAELSKLSQEKESNQAQNTPETGEENENNQ